jgi:hypothetical protein
MSVDVFDVLYCRGKHCKIKESCGRDIEKFKAFFAAQQEVIPTSNVIVTDFSDDLGGSNLTTNCFLDPKEVRV